MAYLKCYLEECMLEALKEPDCFAYCSREHKAKVVMVDYEPTSKPRSVKEMVYRLQQMKQRYLGQQKTS